MTDILPIQTAAVALVSTMLLGMIRSFFDSMKNWHPLATQGTVIAISVSLVAGLHYFNLVPVEYQGALFAVLQGIVAGLGAIGMNNVKDGAKYGSAGATPENRKLENTDVYVAKRNTGAEE